MFKVDAPSLALGSIHVDWSINARAAMRRETTLEYAAALKAGAKFPPVTVFFDGDVYWLADGFHRYAAYEIAGSAEIPIEIRLGTRRSAALYSAAANGFHGLRPTRSDRRRAIIRLLEDPEWTLWTNHQIAALCGATTAMVGELRHALQRFQTGQPANDPLPTTVPIEGETSLQMAG